MTAAVGQTLNGVPDIGLLVLTTRDGRRSMCGRRHGHPGRKPVDQRLGLYAKRAGAWSRGPGVSLAIAKRAGANAVNIAHALETRLEALEGTLIPGTSR